MGIFGKKLFSWKSAAEQKKEQEEYEKWAFPYGDKQRDNLKSLLFDIFGKDEGFILFTYLTCKEMYEKALSDLGCRDSAIEEMVDNRLGIRLQIIKQLKQKDWLLYIALVLADENVNEDCEYPTAEKIIAKAQKLGR